MRIASFNVEKDGQSSTLDKQAQVNFFIEHCCKELCVDLIFLCEIHSARLKDFVEFLATVYGEYRVASFTGGYSNGYVIMAKKTADIDIASQGDLFGLSRPLLLAKAQGVNKYTGYVLLAHFKSGGTGLTKKEIEFCATFAAKWVLTGDLNYDFKNLTNLNPPGVGYECWKGKSTHAKGGILDWVLASLDVKVEPVDLTPLETTFDMTGPDHRPIVFDIFSG